MRTKIKVVKGILKLREVPFDNEEEFKYWWVDEKDPITGLVIRPARMSLKEKERYTLLESENTLTTSGRNQLLTYLGQSSGTPILFAKFFSVGTGAISSVSPADTTMATELFRKAPTGTTITGTQQDVSILFATTDGNGIWSNAGFWGNSATSTLGSGTLYTHALFSYPKTSALSVTSDYVFILQFV